MPCEAYCHSHLSLIMTLLNKVAELRHDVISQKLLDDCEKS